MRLQSGYCRLFQFRVTYFSPSPEVVSVRFSSCPYFRPYTCPSPVHIIVHSSHVPYIFLSLFASLFVSMLVHVLVHVLVLVPVRILVLYLCPYFCPCSVQSIPVHIRVHLVTILIHFHFILGQSFIVTAICKASSLWTYGRRLLLRTSPDTGEGCAYMVALQFIIQFWFYPFLHFQFFNYLFNFVLIDLNFVNHLNVVRLFIVGWNHSTSQELVTGLAHWRKRHFNNSNRCLGTSSEEACAHKSTKRKLYKWQSL